MSSAVPIVTAHTSPAALPLISPAPSSVTHQDTAPVACAPAPPAGADWSTFGAVVPVLAGSAGAGASVFAAAAVDVLQRAGRCALLVDAAEPSRSGLCCATEVDGEYAAVPAAGVAVRYSWRGHAVLARREAAPEPNQTRHAPATHRAERAGQAGLGWPDGLGALPGLEPSRWLPLPPLEPLHTTVVDLGGQWAHPHHGPGDPLATGALAWLRAARAGLAPRPVLVVRATRPSLAAAEAALARLDAYLGAGQLMTPVRLVVMASWKKNAWPRGVTGTAGARVSRLLDDAVFVPYDHDLDVGGITALPCPARVQAAVAEVLGDWGLLPPSTR